MSVISFAAEREARQPHWHGLVRCVGCQHEWEAVAPVEEGSCASFTIPADEWLAMAASAA